MPDKGWQRFFDDPIPLPSRPQAGHPARRRAVHHELAEGRSAPIEIDRLEPSVEPALLRPEATDADGSTADLQHLLKGLLAWNARRPFGRSGHQSLL